jgi:hypothetical protein
MPKNVWFLSDSAEFICRYNGDSTIDYLYFRDPVRKILDLEDCSSNWGFEPSLLNAKRLVPTKIRSKVVLPRGFFSTISSIT